MKTSDLTPDQHEILTQILEYMVDRQDADGDSEGFYPNEEMQLASALMEAFPGLDDTLPDSEEFIARVRYDDAPDR
jgi:hypothetical protein